MTRPIRWALLLAAVLAPAAAPADADAEADDGPEVACNPQSPLPFLVRENYVLHRATSPADRLARKALHKRAIKWRTLKYGYVEGFGDPTWNRLTPKNYAKKTRFMGLRVAVNRKVAPALACVEREIHAACGDAYKPVSLSGLRGTNTFYDGEVSNHTYGIAVDVDPEKNFCCGCVGPAARHPACKRQAVREERMKMPMCWVSSFEKYGFYWLGHDELEDNMHFEFLADPDKIVRKDRAGADVL